MSWREKLVVRILLLVAQISCGDDGVAQEIKALSNHIQAHAQVDDE